MVFDELQFRTSDANRRVDDEMNYEDRKELHIGDRFWNMMLAKVCGRNVDVEIENPEMITITFNSQRERVKRRETEVTQAIEDGREGVKKIDRRVGDVVRRRPLVGNFNLDSHQITFNLSYDEMSAVDERTKSTELTQVIIHELVHYMQKKTNKYPKMRGIEHGQLVDTESPWEAEAYKLQCDQQLNRLFKDDCNFMM